MKQLAAVKGQAVVDHYVHTWHACVGRVLAMDVTSSPRTLQDPAVQALQAHAHQIAEEQVEDDAIVGRLVSATNPSEFREATGAPPRQYAIHRRQKSCD